MDEDIRERIDAGDLPEAFEGLLARYHRKVFRLAFSILGEQATAEDMVQEVFFQIWRALPEYRGEASLSTWIYAITRNRCLTRRKQIGARLFLSMQTPGVEAAVEARSGAGFGPPDSDNLGPLLARLPPPYRQALTLFYWEEKSYEQVAAMMNLPVGTVKTYLHRARKQLAEAMMSRTYDL